VASRASGAGSLADFYRPDDGTMQFFLRNNSIVGSISVAASATAYNVSSDHRLKTNVNDLASGLATVEAIRPRTYDWISSGEQGVGFVAHELQEVVPLAVTGTKDAVDDKGEIVPQQVDASKLVPHLVAAIQELSAKVAALEAK
jgi:hypothetical protein